jgi:hypothetical protein
VNVVIAFLHSMIALWMRFEMLRERVEVGLEAWKEVFIERDCLGFIYDRERILGALVEDRAWRQRRLNKRGAGEVWIGELKET